jgi:hypothetical protein
MNKQLNMKILRISLVIFLTAFFSISQAKSPELSKRDLSVPPPRIIRTCCGFGAEIGVVAVPFFKKTDITSLEKIGVHKFMGGGSEDNGIIYTRRGGFIDLGHLRDCADWTAYLYNLITASRTDAKFLKMELRNEGGEKSLELNVPANLNEEQIIELAGRIAYDLSLWHEISTWFGARYVPLVPEKFSSFSPEDMYSNLLGVHMGMRAVKSNLSFDEAMTEELSNMLDTLQAVKTEEATFNAMKSVNNVWYTNDKRYPSNEITLRRYLDLEFNLTPWLIPDEECILPPYLLRIPDKKMSEYYTLSLKLNYRFPVDSIFADRTDRVVTQNDFDRFVDFIKLEVYTKELFEDKTPAKQGNKKQRRKESKSNSPTTMN